MLMDCVDGSCSLQGEEDCPCAHVLQAAKRTIHSGKAPVRGVLGAGKAQNFLLTWLASKSRLRKGSASRSVELHFGNTVELREVPKALPTKPCVKA